jgi:hypothetical protein
MGTASLFDDVLKQELNIHAAWLPVTNTFEIGDYGIASGGVLVKMGNIRQFGVAWTAGDGPPATLNFTTKGTNMVRVVGNAKVDAFPNAPVDASLTIEFEHDSSFFLKTALTVSQMQDLAAVADRLAQVPQWKSQYRVVSATYTGRQCTILSSKAANSKIALSGKADALRQLDLASASAGIDVSSSEQIGLNLVGETGVVGLSLFKLRWLVGGVRVLDTGRPDDPNAKLAVDTNKDWDHLADDV